ncbi:hypothetical protein Tco_1486229 [Tanacetum coccineum]
MSQPANDVFSQHLSDDEASYHEDASDNGTATNKPKQQQQQLTPTTTTISNIKLPILKNEEYDIWAMEMEHYLEYIDNEIEILAIVLQKAKQIQDFGPTDYDDETSEDDFEGLFKANHEPTRRQN